MLGYSDAQMLRYWDTPHTQILRYSGTQILGYQILGDPDTRVLGYSDPQIRIHQGAARADRS